MILQKLEKMLFWKTINFVFILLDSLLNHPNNIVDFQNQTFPYSVVCKQRRILNNPKKSNNMPSRRVVLDQYILRATRHHTVAKQVL